MAKANSTIVSSAEFSDDELYRYSLTRTVLGEECRKLLFALLNPSRADAILNDETVMNCQNIAFSEGRSGHNPPFGPFNSFRVCNLFSRVGTNVADLQELTASLRISEPEDAQRNDRAIGIGCDWADAIVCGWGDQLDDSDRRCAVIGMLQECGKPLWCLGVTEQGNPRHPSRGQQNKPMERFQPQRP